MIPYTFKKSGDVEEKPEPVGLSLRGEARSISIPLSSSNNFVANKIEKANSLASKRKEIHRKKNLTPRGNQGDYNFDQKSKTSISNFDNLND